MALRQRQTPVRMPPKSAWYVHLYRDRTTKVTHGVFTTRRSYKRKPKSHATCGIRISGMWPRPPGRAGMTCPKCLRVYNALDILLEDA